MSFVENPTKTTIEAIVDHGILRPTKPLDLNDGIIVEVTITTKEKFIQDKNPARLLSEIASLPIEGDGTPFSARDHDKILYPETSR